MYGMFYHLQPKAEQQQAAWDHLFRWEQEILPVAAGYVGGYIFQSPPLPEIVAIFIFAEYADYARLLDEAKHVQWQQDLLPLIEVIPQCRDGEFTEFMKELRGL
jgi:hypothetical protein